MTDSQDHVLRSMGEGHRDPPACKECGLLQVEVFDVGCLGTGNCRWPLADKKRSRIAGARDVTPAERERLARILGMLGSEHAGERAAAGLQAEAFRKKHGLTWADLLALPPVEVVMEPEPGGRRRLPRHHRRRP